VFIYFRHNSYVAGADFFCSILIGLRPQLNMPNPGARHRFVAKPAAASTIALEQQLLSEGDSGSAAKEAHWRCYEEFCVANQLDPVTDFQKATPRFAASLLEQNRLPSTVKVYMLHLKEHVEQQQKPFDALIHALDVRIARRGHDHAMDLDVASISSLLSHAFVENSERTLAMAFMWCTGVRCQDLKEIRGKQVDVTKEFFRVEIRLAKNTRHALDRAEIRVPIEWLPPMAEGIIVALIERIQRARVAAPEEPLFGTLSVASLNALLVTAWKKEHRLQIDKAHQCPTSYTFRRSFLEQISKRCMDADGQVDYKRVCQFTLHKSEKTPRAYYAKHVSDVETQ
jgi:integrase